MKKTEEMIENQFIERKSKERCTVTDRIPGGGFGQLYKAIDKRSGKSFCVKLLEEREIDAGKSAESLSPEKKKRRKREREIEALKTYSNKRNIVHLYDEGYLALFEPSTDDPKPYLLIPMEYIDGTTLGQSKARIDQEIADRLDPDRALQDIFQLCSAVHSLHARGRYHQDIFPDNVMLEKKTGRLVLLDLGHVRRFASQTMLAGGQPYSAPEKPLSGQQSLFRAAVGGRFDGIDLFSIGALFYDMLRILKERKSQPFFEDGDVCQEYNRLFYDGCRKGLEGSSPCRYYGSLDLSSCRNVCPYGNGRDGKELMANYQEKSRLFREDLESIGLNPDFARSVHFFPQQRPTIDELLGMLFECLLRRGKSHFSSGKHPDALRELERIATHFLEVERESAHEDFRGKAPNPMIHHLQDYGEFCLEALLGWGTLCYHANKIDEALEKLEKGEEMLKKLGEWGANLSPDTRDGYRLKFALNQASCWARQKGGLDRAIDYLLSLKDNPFDGAFRSVYYSNLAALYLAAGKKDQARKCLKEFEGGLPAFEESFQVARCLTGDGKRESPTGARSLPPEGHGGKVPPGKPTQNRKREKFSRGLDLEE